MDVSPRALAGFVALARAQSPLLRELALQVRQTRLDSLRRRAQNLPQITANVAAVFSPTLGAYGYDQAVTNGGNYASLAQATQPLLNRPLLNNDYATLGTLGLSQRNSGRLSALDLRRTVTDQYLLAYAAQSQLGLSRALLTELRQQDQQLRKLVDAGIFKQTQYLSFYLSVRTQEVAVEQSQLSYRRELGTLRGLCGVLDTTLTAIEAPPLPTRRPLTGLRAPALRQYVLDSLRLGLERRAVNLTYRPRLSAVLDAGLQSSQYQLPALSRSLGLSGGLLLSFPIFDGRQRGLQLQRLDLSEEARRGYRDFVGRQRRQQYAQLLSLVAAADALLVRLRQQLRVAQALVRASRQQLANGDAAILDYLTLVTAYRTLQFSLVQAENDRLRSLYALDYLGE